MTSKHPLTRADADRISVYEHLRWYTDPTTRPLRTAATSDDHLEELARVAAIIAQLNGWQALGVHRAVQAGASLPAIADALGEDIHAVAARWSHWAAGQRQLWASYAPADRQAGRAIGLDPAESAVVDEAIQAQLRAAESPGDRR